MIVFGGREGDGKKRIVNDIFIFDTGKAKNSLYNLTKSYSDKKIVSNILIRFYNILFLF